MICLEQPQNFYAVGEFYRNFPQVEDDEVIEALRTARIGLRSKGQ
jgi:predicted phosphoribosyltransferase